MRENKGITLIALIITIVVMLILVAVSVNVLIKSNLIGTAEKTADKYKTASEEEANGGTIEINGKKYNSIDDYIAGKDAVEWEKILDNVKKEPKKYIHPDQITDGSYSNNDVGIGTDGKPVNLDLWTYIVIDSTKKELAVASDTGTMSRPGYQNFNIIDGKIQGKVPQYVYMEEYSDIYTVTSMDSTFYGCTNLTTAPEIPSTVTNMDNTFCGCTKLVAGPKIPDEVTTMHKTFGNCTSLTSVQELPSSLIKVYGTFEGCTSLVQAPAIPSNVTDMQEAFSGCTKLTTIPKLPESIRKMTYAFEGCTSLVQAPEIPSKVTDLSSTFSGCTSLAVAPELPSGIYLMNATFSGCTNLVTATTIPSSVTNLTETFFGCKKLQGNIEINAKPLSGFGTTGYDKCFGGGAATEGTGLVVTGSSSKLKEIIATGDSTKITKGQ